MTSARVERKHLVRSRDIHDAVDDDRNCLQSEVLHVLAIVRSIWMEQRPERNRKRPFHAQRAHVRFVDRGERAVAVSADVSVERRPLARLWVENAAEIDSCVHGPAEAGPYRWERARFDAGQST